MNPPPETLTASQPSTPLQLTVNDLSIEAATVNGTGSQSANNILAKSLFRMGIPMAAKNLFPSNIQGLPTWFTIRASKHGYTARKKELDWLIGMNPTTWEKDVANLRPGAVVMWNSNELSDAPVKARGDLIAYPIPMNDCIKGVAADAKLKKMLVNMVYVGAVTHLLGIEEEVVLKVIADQFKSKQKAVEINVACLRAGMEYAKASLPKKDPYRVERMDANGNKILIEGNTIAALGCLMGGVTVMGWYPITPSSSLAEALIALAKKHRVDAANHTIRFADVQCEDELASIGLVLGAGWAGARSMTTTAGPGISLMSEFVGLGYYAELPGVIFDVQRVGPSTGLPTRTAQGDVLAAAFCSHGDTEHLVLHPCSPEECYEFARISFDYAERYQTPVFVLLDLDLGMNFWMCEPPSYTTEAFDRGKVLSPAKLDELKAAGKKWGRYLDMDGDGIPWRPLPGNPHPDAAYFTRGSGHDEYARYSEDPEVYRRNLDRLRKKIEGSRTTLPQPVLETVPGAKVGILAYGSTNNAMREARDQLAAAGVKSDYLRIRATPLATAAVEKFFKEHERVYIVEQNRDGQMELMIRQVLTTPGAVDKIRPVRHYTGFPIDARTISDGVLAGEGKR
ncbi:MAG: 2-oxoacid:acceptor oxidoreductase subunit alpha [Planctomycetes bacterium]|nr:2-oxoacid:acceptor oxidoreductase subunit alpha [Planctomycetota bacterium]